MRAVRLPRTDRLRIPASKTIIGVPARWGHGEEELEPVDVGKDLALLYSQRAADASMPSEVLSWRIGDALLLLGELFVAVEVSVTVVLQLMVRV